MKISFSFLFLLLSVVGFGQSKVKVNVTNFKSDKGVLRACIYSNKAAFGGNGSAVQCTSVTISNKQTSFEFSVPEGTYAISVFHDANNNDKIDKNFLGIPTEGYGASKNSLPFAGAPTFDGNRFAVGKNATVTLEIKLRYL